MPAAMARIAMIMGNPEKLKWSNSINPVKISQIASTSIPRFLVIFIVVVLPFFNYLSSLISVHVIQVLNTI